MSRNAMNACIDAANERDDQRETALREWAELPAKPMGLVERLRNGGQADLADMAEDLVDALSSARTVLFLLSHELSLMGLKADKVLPKVRAALEKAGAP